MPPTTKKTSEVSLEDRVHAIEVRLGLAEPETEDEDS